MTIAVDLGRKAIKTNKNKIKFVYINQKTLCSQIFNNPFRKRRDYFFFSVVHKTIMSIAGEPKSKKNLRSGDLLIQCAKESHKKSTTDEDILWSKVLRHTPFSLEHIQRYYSLSSLEQSDKR